MRVVKLLVITAVLICPMGGLCFQNDTIGSIHGHSKKRPANAAAHPAHRSAPTARRPARPTARAVPRHTAPVRAVTRAVRSAVHAAAPAPPKRPTEIVVDPNGQGTARTITDALHMAQSGARILVRPGFYVESVFIDKPVEIVAEAYDGNSTTIASPTAPPVVMSAERASLKGFSIEPRAGYEGVVSSTVDVPGGKLDLEDCNIFGASRAGVLAHGPTAEVHLTRCSMHGGAHHVLELADHAHAVLEDCDLGGSAESVALCSQGSGATMKRCHVHNGMHEGLVLLDGSDADLLDSDFYANGWSGISIFQASNPRITHCQFHENVREGIFVAENGRGDIQGCDIYGNGAEGVAIRSGANPYLHDCTMPGGPREGVFVREKGQGLLERCDISGSLDGACVAIVSEGQPTFRDCKIHDGRKEGVWMDRAGAATFDGCRVYSFGRECFHIDASAPFLKKCTITDSKQDGIHFLNHARGTVAECDIGGNTNSGVWVQIGSDPTLTSCQIHDNATYNGIGVSDGSRGRVEGCYLYNNAQNGMVISGQSSVTVIRCKSYSNRGPGYAVMDTSRGVFEDCESYSNGRMGLFREAKARVVLRNCRVDGTLVSASTTLR